MNPSTGTFISMDPAQGSIFDPVSLHTYLYANANPVMNCDPSGRFTLGEMLETMAIQAIIGSELGALSGMVTNYMTFKSDGGKIGSASYYHTIWDGFWKGALTGAGFGALFGALAIIGTEYIMAYVLMGVILSYMGFSSLGNAIEYYGNGDTLRGNLSLLGAVLCFFGAGASFTRAYSGYMSPGYVTEGTGEAAGGDGRVSNPNALHYNGDGTWTSNEGLVYGQGSAQGNRVLHVLEHTVPNPNKPLQTLFNVDGSQVIGLIDEAWAV